MYGRAAGRLGVAPRDQRDALLWLGNAWDYDHWRQPRNEVLEHDDWLPSLQKADNNERGATSFHGACCLLTPDRAIAEDQRGVLKAAAAGHKK